MQTENRDKFRAVMAGMAKMYDKEIDDPLLDAYWMALRDWSLTDFETAASHLMATATFMPRPAEFNNLRKAGEPTAGEAWQTALSGAKLDSGSRIERAANIIGGQQYIRHADIEKELPHIMRRFIQVYDELSEVDEKRSAVPQITRNEAKGILGAVYAKLAQS